MKKKLVLIVFIFCGLLSQSQQCPRLSNPQDGSIEVPVNTTITWPKVGGVVGYVVSLGTIPGGTDILNGRSAGQMNFFSPEVGLPENSIIYVTIAMFLPNQQFVTCPGESFRTVDVTKPPPCTRLIEPVANGTNVGVSKNLTWAYSPTATGYRISIGTSANSFDLLDNVDVGNVLSYNPPTDFELDREVFVKIIPYNENGDATPCIDESFTTGVPIFDCDAVVDRTTGETYSLKPEINFPDEIGLCYGELSKDVNSLDSAGGFRWYKLNQDGSETILSETDHVTLEELGRYRYEAYNTVSISGTPVECSNTKEFQLIRSEPATIYIVEIKRQPSGLSITVIANGPGNYEFALDSEVGPFKDPNRFENVPLGEHTVFVRDKNGCGTVSRVVERALSPKDFPQFFTPNGDGINDFWQFTPPPDIEINIEVIQIFDRSGNFIAQIDPKSAGWDGSFNGQPLPASDYWFRSTTASLQEIRGHFALKR